jgi:multidrug resistance efflux pump
MTRMTKAQLVDENIRLRAQCDLLEGRLAAAQRDIEELRAQAQQAPTRVHVSGARGSRPDCTEYNDYWDYVRACKEWARANNLRVVSYKTRQQFNDAWNDVGPDDGYVQDYSDRSLRV